MSDTPPICRDCKFCHPASDLVLRLVPSTRWRYATCRHPSSKKVEEVGHPLVTGKSKVKRDYFFCTTMRETILAEHNGHCGREGRYFEPREK